MSFLTQFYILLSTCIRTPVASLFVAVKINTLNGRAFDPMHMARETDGKFNSDQIQDMEHHLFVHISIQSEEGERVSSINRGCIRQLRALVEGFGGRRVNNPLFGLSSLYNP